ncbi:MAG: LTA synthase family protein [Clostridia bacterium]|nr:LTA synthase family protein [Clostridia bacterium]
MENKRNFGILWTVLCAFFVTLAYLLLFAALWFTRSFGAEVGFDAVLFTLFSDMHGVGTKAVWEAILQVFLPTLLASSATFFLLRNLPKILWKDKIAEGRVLLLHRLIAVGLSVVLLVSLTWYSVCRTGLDTYVSARMNQTTIFEDHYVDPNSVEITFPEEKRNLIYIYLESMETAYMSEEDGGSSPVNYIPELTQLAKDNLNFSHSDGIGGGRTTVGSTWTIAAMISQTSGLPLCLPNGIWNNGLNNYSQVMPGMTSLTDILHENGYDQTLMVGSDASFGGRREYFTQHGIDRVYDLFTAREEGLIPSDYWNEFWGFEDLYLFQYAKEKLTEIAQGNEPFAFTMLTVDTHHPDGYNCCYCNTNYDDHFEDYEPGNQQFANVISCSSRQVAEFVEWIQSQDFYENTTIIITGDHLSMNNAYHNIHTSSDYIRRVYNCVINCPTPAVRAKNRNFTTLDMFPTTLAAIGCEIEGNRLGLGTNLFSDRNTLYEEIGYSYLCDEINKVSDFYQNTFLYGKNK